MPKTQNAYYQLFTNKTVNKNVRKRTIIVRVRTLKNLRKQDEFISQSSSRSNNLKSK
jgi:hypothetical protein